jgi:uncharacterized membrane protein YcaP (DUF421 family)
MQEYAMWQMSLPWWEFVIRAIVVYAFLTVILRLTGKRQMGHLAPFDLILLLVLSNAVQNAMNGGDNSVAAGVISATTLVALNYVVSLATFRDRRLARLIEGKPLILIRNGKIDHHARRSAMLTLEELHAALRTQDVHAPEHVRYAFLENTGEITVIPMRAPATTPHPTAGPG